MQSKRAAIWEMNVQLHVRTAQGKGGQRGGGQGKCTAAPAVTTSKRMS